MPRLDDSGNTRLYISHLSSRTKKRDLEKVFSRYGRIRTVDMKRNCAFVEFSDPRDADDARYNLDDQDVDGSRIIVEFAKGVSRGSRESGKFPAPGSGRCFNCGIEGHWARDCKAGDWKNKCYRCGERGHIKQNCKSSPQKLSHGQSYSRSPVKADHRRSRDRSHSRGRSYSRCRSPAMRRRSVDPEERFQSPRDLSPGRHSSPPSRNRRSPSPGERSPRKRRSVSPQNGREHSHQDGSDYRDGPKRKNTRNPGVDGHENKSYIRHQTNSLGQSASRRDDRRPHDDDDDDDDGRRSSRVSESS